MNVLQLYKCLSIEEKNKLKEMLFENEDFGKVSIYMFIKDNQLELSYRMHEVLEGVYNGKFRYKCNYIEDLDFNKLSMIRGIGEKRIENLKYLIKKTNNDSKRS
jgi:hypothetical protein